MGAEELFASFILCRDAGEAETAKLCIQLFAFQMRPQLIAKASRNCDPQLAEEVADATIESVLQATEPDDEIPFEGSERLQLHKWVYTILERRIADHYRRDERRKSIVSTESLDAPIGDEGGTRSETHGEDEDGFHDVELRELRLAVLAGMNPDHRRTVELGLRGYDSREIAEMTGTTANNVDQIRSRYRKLYRQALIDAGIAEE